MDTHEVLFLFEWAKYAWNYFKDVRTFQKGTLLLVRDKINTYACGPAGLNSQDMAGISNSLKGVPQSF